MWSDALDELGRLGRAIAYDRRGYGRSERPEPRGPMNVAEHADDAAALLDAIDAAPAIVIGRSYGGEVATDLALRHHERVRALVLLEGAPVRLLPAAEEATLELRDRLREVAEREGDGALGEALIGAVMGDDAWSSLPEQARQVISDNGPGALADIEGGWLDVDAAALAAIERPVLLVGASDSDPVLRDANDVMAAALPDARTAAVEGGHLVDPAHPVVTAFVQEVLDSR